MVHECNEENGKFIKEDALNTYFMYFNYKSTGGRLLDQTRQVKPVNTQ